MTLEVLPSGNGRGKRLLIDGKADVARTALTQLVVQDPGRYQLSWRTVNCGAKPAIR